MLNTAGAHKQNKLIYTMWKSKIKDMQTGKARFINLYRQTQSTAYVVKANTCTNIDEPLHNSQINSLYKVLVLFNNKLPVCSVFIVVGAIISQARTD